MPGGSKESRTGKDSVPQQGIWESISLSFPAFCTFGNATSPETNPLNMTDGYGTVELTEEKKKWTWTAMIVAALGQMCCVVCGVPALLLSVLSYIDHMRGEYDKYIKRKRLALFLGVAAIITGVICLAFLAFSADRVAREAQEAQMEVNDLKAYVLEVREQVAQM